MKLKRCRLTEKQQDRLVEFFVGEMTARTAADLVGINKTTGAYDHYNHQRYHESINNLTPADGFVRAKLLERGKHVS